MEEIYIGTKIVAAEPLDEFTFILSKGQDPVLIRNGMPNQPGYKVRYEDGYIFWFPKETFERAYRKVTLQEAEMVVGGQFVILDSSGSTVKVA